MYSYIRDRNLHLLYQNVRGLRSKCLQLYNNILLHNYDILLFTETWLHKNIMDTELCDDRYDLFRYDRDCLYSNKKTGGGVMVCTRRELTAELYTEWQGSPATESICIRIPGRILNSSSNLFIIVAYLPPDLNDLPTRLDCIKLNTQHIIDKFPSDNIILIGDFNLNFILWSDNYNYTLSNSNSRMLTDTATSFVEHMYFFGLNQYNINRNADGNTLDLCFSSLPCTVLRSTQPLIKEDRYHPSLDIRVLDLHVVPFKTNKEPYFNFHKCDFSAMNNYLKLTDWNELLTCDSVNEAVDAFYTKIQLCFSLFVPTSRGSKNKSFPFWYSRALIKIINEKTKLHRRWKKFGNPRDYDEFSLLRERQHRVQKLCFSQFVDSSEKLIKVSPKYFWKYVKSKRGGSNYPQKFTFNDNTYTDGHNICAIFNTFFKSVFIPPAATGFILPLDEYLCTDTLSRITVTEDMVLKALRSLDRSKGAGCDGIPPIFLASCADGLSFPITILFVRSLKECVFPTVWKKAQIVPIHKKGSKSLINNYRPVSILNAISKLLELLVYEHMYPLIARNVPQTQHGFFRGRSTVSNLALFSNFVLCEMENGGQIDVVYTDIEKAFDRVDHNILLRKLEYLGIHGDLLRWVRSYLTNRSQAVVLGGYRSNFVTISSGVPQGSHLGPLFYNAYLFDIHSVFKNARYILYADDKKIYMKVASVTECERLQDDLNRLINYYNHNRISISIGKCQCISFTRKRNPIIFPYHFNGTLIERNEVVRDLGVYFDSKLTMSTHIDTIISKAYRNLGFLIRTCRPFSDPVSFKIVYYAYVRSVLEYASPVWCPNYNTYINRIESIQKKFVRHLNFVCKKASTAASYENICQTYGLITLKERRQVLDMGFLYDVIRSRLDCPEIVELISLATPKRRTRHTPLLRVPPHNTNYGKNSVFARLPNTYNEHFSCIDPFVGSKHSFLCHVKRHFQPSDS
ncbi:hypothetical protein O3G_MSEX014401 [Manduca sexta]|uniref:Reverse transcriptase domain-containing protein n=1 Tax=Manduca sexta TaxID=7130 RepID=A0A921ZWN9_MANSE|nr:hypothetical protein O3G_MSEX014401 [Manduca sexta]